MLIRTPAYLNIFFNFLPTWKKSSFHNFTFAERPMHDKTLPVLLVNENMQTIKNRHKCKYNTETHNLGA